MRTSLRAGTVSTDADAISCLFVGEIHFNLHRGLCRVSSEYYRFLCISRNVFLCLDFIFVVWIKFYVILGLFAFPLFQSYIGSK